MSEQIDDAVARRRRGAHAGLDLDRIVEAARGFEPEELTLQGVAAELGVTRKALNHHVVDRDGLLQLLAVDSFASALGSLEIDPAIGWRAACEVFAGAVRDSLIAAGSLASYFQLGFAGDFRALNPVETVLEVLVDAGFDERIAGRSLIALSNIAMTCARDRLLVEQYSRHPQDIEVDAALASATPSRFQVMRELTDSGISAGDDEQFGLTISLLLDGLAGQLARNRDQ